jgi:hypothetical protein
LPSRTALCKRLASFRRRWRRPLHVDRLVRRSSEAGRSTNAARLLRHLRYSLSVAVPMPGSGSG